MAGCNVSIGRESLPGLLNGQDGLARLVEAVLNQILEAQMTESLRADRHELRVDAIPCQVTPVSSFPALS